jgi:hypothetical protein
VRPPLRLLAVLLLPLALLLSATGLTGGPTPLTVVSGPASATTVAAAQRAATAATDSAPAPDAAARQAAVDADTVLAPADTTADGEDDAGAGCVARNGAHVCTHGNDAPPVGVDIRVKPSTDQLVADEATRTANRAVRLGLTTDQVGVRQPTRVPDVVLAKAEPAAPTTATPGDLVVQSGTPANPNLTQHVGTSCTGTGGDGKRVQVVYVTTSDQVDRYTQLYPLIQSYAADVDDTLALSAGKTGGNLRVRWVTATDCTVWIQHVVLPPGSLNDIGTTASALSAAGFNDPQRKYLLFAEANVYCGISEAYQNDSATDNPNDTQSYGPLISRVDSGCWNSPNTHSVPAHELMHSLGAVMSTAPNATPGMHCTDESDVMCYVDGAGVVMRQVCPADQERLFDCNNDDYFNTRPAAGSYLATHWDTASSTWLDTILPQGVTYPPTVTGPATITPGLPVTLTATLPSGAAAGSRLTWPVPTPASCTVRPVSATATSSTVTLLCPAATGVGSVVALAAAVSPRGDVGTATFTLPVATGTRALSVGLSASSTTPTAGSPVRLGIAITSGSATVRAGATVWSRPTSSTGPWTRVRARLDTQFGAVSVTVTPRVPTVYRVNVAADPLWTAGSPTITITPR